MEKLIVTPNEAGQRLDKLIFKYLNLAPKSFVYKMMRKKNITLNKNKCTGAEKTSTGDEITFWLSEDTINKFREKKLFQKVACHFIVIEETEDLLAVNKPAGLLSQKAKPEDISVNEEAISYLMERGQVSEKSLEVFKPSICHRLDRNTSGLLIVGKSLQGLQTMAERLKERSIKKYYLCLTAGVIHRFASIEGYLSKDDKTNRVQVSQAPAKGVDYIQTIYEPLGNNGKYTLLKVELVTGKTHQIRAHLASIGHCIAGDAKYGNESVNDYFRKKYHLKHQLLHSWEMDFDGCQLRAPLWKDFEKVLEGEGLWSIYSSLLKD